MFQVGFNAASEGERTVLDMSYVLAFARDRTLTGNPFPILAVSPRSANAYNYPDVINWQQEVNFSITHQLRPGLALGVSYLFEPYRLDDYYTNSLQVVVKDAAGNVVQSREALRMKQDLIDGLSAGGG